MNRTNRNSKYLRPANVDMAMGTVIAMIVGVAVAVFVIIFIGALSGQTFEITEPDMFFLTIVP